MNLNRNNLRMYCGMGFWGFRCRYVGISSETSEKILFRWKFQWCLSQGKCTVAHLLNTKFLQQYIKNEFFFNSYKLQGKMGLLMVQNSFLTCVIYGILFFLKKYIVFCFSLKKYMSFVCLYVLSPPKLYVIQVILKMSSMNRYIRIRIYIKRFG